jgi:hypothetical protein
MNGDKNDEFRLEYYRNLRERLTSQGDRLWKRFNYFLTVEVAVAGAFILGPSGLSDNWRFVGLPALGLGWSLLWFLIAANDLWFYEDRYQAAEAFRGRSRCPAHWGGAPRNERHGLARMEAADLLQDTTLRRHDVRHDRSRMLHLGVAGRSSRRPHLNAGRSTGTPALR